MSDDHELDDDLNDLDENEDATPDPPAPDTDKDETEDEGDEDHDTDVKGVRDPHRKRLSDQAKRYRLERNEQRTRLAELEAELAALKQGDDGVGEGEGQAPASAPELRQELADERERADTAEADLRATRLRLAFHLANGERAEPFRDADVALTMIDAEALAVQDDGTVEGLTEAMNYVAQRWPYLVADEITATPIPATGRSGRSTQGPRPTSGAALTEATLRKRFPALGYGR